MQIIVELNEIDYQVIVAALRTALTRTKDPTRTTRLSYLIGIFEHKRAVARAGVAVSATGI